MINTLDQASDFNLAISKAVLSVFKFDIKSSVKLCTIAKVKAKDNKDPYLIESLGALYQSFIQKNIWIDDSSRRQILKQAKLMIDEATISTDIKQDSQIYYY